MTMSKTNIRNLRLSSISLLILPLITLFSACNTGKQKETAESTEYKVAAYYWPAYHDEPRWRNFFDGTEGEWEIIRNATPKYEGHRQPRIPLWGYEDETDPKVMEKKIDAAVDNGVNVLVFDWYWYEGEAFLEECINEGFLGAENNDEIEFYIMWANHAATTLWDKRLSHETDTIWEGGVDRGNFDIITDRIISQYMHHPSYLKIDGQPVFSIYELGTLINGLGGMEQTRDALDSFREKVKKAGFPGLHLQAILWSNIPETDSNVPGYTPFSGIRSGIKCSAHMDDRKENKSVACPAVNIPQISTTGNDIVDIKD